MENPPTAITLGRVAKAEAVARADIVDWIEIIEHVIPVPATDYEANSGNTGGITVSSLGEDDYMMTDSRSGDTVGLISGEDYLLTAGDSGWTTTGLNPSSHIEYEKVPHHETYTLVLNP